ncbi:hypothetical protein VHEMI01940 [[Torrubiella] hemipterigena]|uniref:Trichothecene 3-O-acetyltransferase-like N-terminal domain-containing protein n=1 Tax=[Torrubiella] hemipterigena TaxID=1531966 RepID=A0A0A1T6Q9_9HYPO|nr:hypothetical protein VHEMI01940 [[Torrubiella] hemipterigena]
MASIHLDPLGSLLSMSKTYTNISYIFALNENESADLRAFMIQTTLTVGLERLAGSFPWIAGQSFYGYIEDFDELPLLQMGKRLDLSLNAFLQANWSISLLDPEVYVPQPPQETPSGKPRVFSGSPSPVFMIKVMLITGAAVLTFSANKGALDITGQVTMIRLLSKACRGEAFTEDDVRLASRNLRINLDFTIEKAPIDSRLDVRRRLERTDVPIAPSYHEPDPTLTWVYFLANVSSLEAKKTHVQPNSPLSTDDVLTALIWKSITLSRCPDDSTESFLIRAVNVREAFGLPNTYAGMFQYMAFHKRDARDLMTMPLENLAVYLRDQLAPDTLNPFMRVIAALTYRVTWESPTFKYTWPDRDVHVTSWAEMDCYNHDFGLGLGNPINVLRPCLPAIKEGDVNFMPQTPQGNIMISICLKEQAMENLKINLLLLEFVRTIE